MHVVIFEGRRWPAFAPLSLSRPVFTLVSGMSTLLEKQVRHLRPDRLTLWVRPELVEHCRERILPTLSVPTKVNEPLDDEPALLINGRSLVLSRFEFNAEQSVVCDETCRNVISAFATRPGLSPEDLWSRSDRWLELLKLPHTMPQTRLVESLWDLISWNEESLIEDAVQLHREPTELPAGPYHVLRKEDVWLGENVTLCPGCVLDASTGPVVLGEGVRVGANAVVQGPCHIDAHSQIMPLTLIRPGTSIGTMCRVGGEISRTIIHGYSNKAHEGFLGDSYLGRWVNFGAGTNTSNLKNTYGEITVHRGDHKIATGRRFLGSLVGDHAKTAISTRLQAGSYVGFCSSVVCSTIAPRFVPSFTFLTDRGADAYRMADAIDVTRRVFARRDRPWTETDERIMRYVADVAPRAESGDDAEPPRVE